MQVFKGKKYITFDKYPEWYGGKDHLVKVLLNLYFTKLVIRIKVDGYTEQALNAAKKCFPKISNILRGNLYKIDLPEFEELNEYISNRPEDFHYIYCYNCKGDLIGSLEDYKSILGLDCVLDIDDNNVFYSHKLNAYIAHGRMGYKVFKIGDILFDEKWRPAFNKKDNYVASIPYDKRGNRIIKILEESKQAAINLSNYMN